MVGKVLDGELAEAQGLVVVSAAAPSPREASPGTPAAVIEPAALGRPRRRAAVVAVVAVERGPPRGGERPRLWPPPPGPPRSSKCPGGGGPGGRGGPSIARSIWRWPVDRDRFETGRDARGDYASEEALDTGRTVARWKGADSGTKRRNGFARCRSVRGRSAQRTELPYRPGFLQQLAFFAARGPNREINSDVKSEFQLRSQREATRR